MNNKAAVYHACAQTRMVDGGCLIVRQMFCLKTAAVSPSVAPSLLLLLSPPNLISQDLSGRSLFVFKGNGFMAVDYLLKHLGLHISARREIVTSCWQAAQREKMPLFWSRCIKQLLYGSFKPKDTPV